VTAYLATAAASYFLGSIPTGFLVARARGIDIRSVGSGNIGATNVFRTLGKTAGILVMLADAAKGFLACCLVAPVMTRLLTVQEASSPAVLENFKIAAGIAAILGHNYTCWLGFKGGKGVATTAGVLLALFPKAFLVGLGVWLLVLAVSRYVSLASITAAAALPFAVWLGGASGTLIAVATFLGALAIYKHRSNIGRLLNGTEHRFGRKKPEEPSL